MDTNVLDNSAGTDFSALLEPARIGKMVLKNRIVMSPMGTLAENNDGTISAAQMDYFEARARGGAAMVITGGQLVTNRFDHWAFGMTGLDTDAQTRSWRLLTDRVKAFGTKTCCQLSCGFGRNGFKMPGVEAPIVSASAVPSYYTPEQITRPLSHEEIQFLVEANARAAYRAQRAGFDAIEIHGHVGYLLDQFMSELWNNRTDQYGGSFENRMRFPREVIEAVRGVVGPDYPLLFRLSLEHGFPGGRTLEDGLEIVKYLEKIGIDGIDINIGSYETHALIGFSAYFGDATVLYAAAAAKEITKLPVLCAGNFTPETAIAAVHEGELDFVMLGRSLLAEPEWVNKLADGRREEIRPCIRCNDFCMTAVTVLGCTASCAVNAAVNAERIYQLAPAATPKHVVVIGGGPAGMEAARVAATKGHKVDLYERGPELGGRLLAATAPFKSQIRALVAYFHVQMMKLGVNVHLNTSLAADAAELETADHVFVAIGAQLKHLDLPGAERPEVMHVFESYRARRAELGNTLVILGGDKLGSDAALEYALEGKDVTLIEASGRIAASASADDQMSLREDILKHGGKILLNHTALEITGAGVRVRGPDGNVTVLKADQVLYDFGRLPEPDFIASVLGKNRRAIAVGDCDEPGVIGSAIRRAYFAAWGMD